MNHSLLFLRLFFLFFGCILLLFGSSILSQQTFSIFLLFFYILRVSEECGKGVDEFFNLLIKMENLSTWHYCPCVRCLS